MNKLQSNERIVPLPNISNANWIWFRCVIDLVIFSIYRSLSKYSDRFKGNVLEVGCGSRPYRNLFVKARYQGIDHNDAKKFNLNEEEDVKYYDGQIFPVENEEYDICFHSQVMEHVPDTVSFLKECNRSLKPGGLLIFTVPFSYRFHYIPHDYFRWTPSALERLLVDTGFKDISVEPLGSDLTTVSHKIIIIFYGLIFSNKTILKKIIGFMLVVLFLPFLIIVHSIGLISIWFDIGSKDDPLGYTVTAIK